MHISKMYVGKDYIKSLSKSNLLGITALMATLLSSCHTKENTQPEETRFVAASESDDFHADNDIAMTIRSIVDAIKVGEPLDSTLYDFEGVLTDGQGTPLYTDIQGAPGMWEIDVVDNQNVIVRNLYLGDLLPDALRSYLLESLDMAFSVPHTLTDSLVNINDHARKFLYSHDNEYNEISIYELEGGYICFELQQGVAPNGQEGPLLSIIMTADYPDLKADEK